MGRMTNRSRLEHALNLLTGAEAILGEAVDARRDIAENRSDRWKVSEKAYDYEDRTSELDEARTEAEAAAIRIETFLEN